MGIHQADPAARKRLITTVVIVLVIAALGGLWLQHWSGQISSLIKGGQVQDAQKQINAVMNFAFLLISLGLLVLGLISARHAKQAIAQKRFPSKEAKLLKNVEVQEGDSAVTLGKVNYALAAVFLLGALLCFPFSLFGLG
jgi:hypothetical protein